MKGTVFSDKKRQRREAGSLFFAEAAEVLKCYLVHGIIPLFSIGPQSDPNRINLIYLRLGTFPSQQLWTRPIAPTIRSSANGSRSPPV